MRVHVFYASPHRTHDGQRICEFCGSAETAKVHTVPERSDEERKVDARRIGEGGE